MPLVPRWMSSQNSREQYRPDSAPRAGSDGLHDRHDRKGLTVGHTFSRFPQYRMLPAGNLGCIVRLTDCISGILSGTNPGTARPRMNLPPQLLLWKGRARMPRESAAVAELTVDRRTNNRRLRMERRVKQDQDPVGEERRSDEDRRENKVERRRQIDPTTCERDYQPDEIEFMRAMDDYKRRSGRQFPTWSEVLEVLRDLGYRKVAEPTTTYE